MASDESPKREDNKLFPPTRWSPVAQSREPEAAGKALAELCTIYWYPVYAYIRSMGKNHHDGQDLTQAFFLSLLEREDFAKAESVSDGVRELLWAMLNTKEFMVNH